MIYLHLLASVCTWHWTSNNLSNPSHTLILRTPLRSTWAFAAISEPVTRAKTGVSTVQLGGHFLVSLFWDCGIVPEIHFPALDYFRILHRLATLTKVALKMCLSPSSNVQMPSVSRSIFPLVPKQYNAVFSPNTIQEYFLKLWFHHIRDELKNIISVFFTFFFIFPFFLYFNLLLILITLQIRSHMIYRCNQM